MLYTLAEVKKEIRKIEKTGSVSKVTVSVQEFGEGFDTHVDIWYVGSYGKDFENFQTGEEEPKSKAMARAKRQFESLKGRGFEVEFEGLTNC